MKFLKILFAFYIFLSPCFPCAEEGECNDSSQTEINVSHTDIQDDHHENETCNPFCSCACCGQVFTTGDKLAKTGPPQDLDNQDRNHLYENISLPSDFFGNIWQPPRNS